MAYDGYKLGSCYMILTDLSWSRRNDTSLYVTQILKRLILTVYLWEISLPNARLTQIDEDILWYHCEGVHGFTVLKKVGPATDFEDS